MIPNEASDFTRTDPPRPTLQACPPTPAGESFRRSRAHPGLLTDAGRTVGAVPDIGPTSSARPIIGHCDRADRKAWHDSGGCRSEHLSDCSV